MSVPTQTPLGGWRVLSAHRELIDLEDEMSVYQNTGTPLPPPVRWSLCDGAETLRSLLPPTAGINVQRSLSCEGKAPLRSRASRTPEKTAEHGDTAEQSAAQTQMEESRRTRGSRGTKGDNPGPESPRTSGCERAGPGQLPGSETVTAAILVTTGPEPRTPAAA
ncbi:unnamed protein product [Boreogadus saida]